MAKNATKKIHGLIFLFAVLAASAAPFSACDASEARHPFVAGSFYPADPAVLSEMIDDLLAKAPAPSASKGDPVALIVPHAGYIFSGQTAAVAYKEIQGRHYDTVVVVGLYHKAPFKGASVWKEGAWKTPLGEVSVDTELAAAILKENEAFGFTQ